jgi:GT2 family glycosyltransferase
MADGLTDSCSQARGDPASVAVVVVTYNRKELLSRCLDALLAQTHPLHAIFVIDNASTDGTGELISRCYCGRVAYERLPHNTGGAGGFHAGMRRAVAAGVEWVWVMDDDVRPEPRALEVLIRAASDDFVVPVPVRVSDLDGALEEAACVEYDMRSAWRAPGRHMTSVKSVFAGAGDLPPMLELANCSFEGPLIPARSIHRIGLPLSGFFIYGDDTEFALRLRKSGMRLILVREARVRRMLTGAGAAANGAWKTRYIIRNSFWINRLHGRNLTTRHLRNYFWAVALLAVNVLRLRFLRDPKRFAAALRGILEGLRARLPGIQWCAAAPVPLAKPGPPEPAAAPIVEAY